MYRDLFIMEECLKRSEENEGLLIIGAAVH